MSVFSERLANLLHRSGSAPSAGDTWVWDNDDKVFVPGKPGMRVYNVRDYEAVGDGSTDDTAAIQSAVTAATTAGGGTVFFPRGTYKLQTAVTAISNVRFLLEYGAVLKPISTHAITVATTVSNFAVEGGKLDCSSQTAGDGINITAATRITIRNLEISTTYAAGVRADGVTDLVVEGCYIHNCGDAQTTDVTAHGLRIHTATRVRVTNNRIEDCTRRFSHGVAVFVQTDSEADSTDIVIANNVIRNCGRAASGGGGIRLSSDVSGYRVSRATVTGNAIYNSGDGGIWINADNVACAGNMIDTMQVGAGIEVSDCREVAVTGNTVLNSVEQAGIWVHPTASPHVGLYDITISGNVVDEVTGSAAIADGIVVSDDSTTGINSARVTISGNTVRNADSEGIHVRLTRAVTIIGNTVADSGANTTNTYSGIKINGENPAGAGTPYEMNVLVMGNRSSGSDQYAGIAITQDADYITVIGNDVRGNQTAGFFNGSSGTTIKVRHNTAWVTENSGTDTVSNGATTKNVTHGLAVTPAAKDIQIVPTNNMGNATKFWISAVAATTFTVSVDADPGATTFTFAWQAQVL